MYIYGENHEWKVHEYLNDLPVPACITFSLLQRSYIARYRNRHYAAPARRLPGVRGGVYRTFRTCDTRRKEDIDDDAHMPIGGAGFCISPFSFFHSATAGWREGG